MSPYILDRLPYSNLQLRASIPLNPPQKNKVQFLNQLHFKILNIGGKVKENEV